MGSLLSVYGQNEPITTKTVITIRADLFATGSTSDARQRVVPVETLLERLRRVSGVDVAAVMSADFLNGGRTPPRFLEPTTASAARIIVEAHAVTDDYFRLMELQLVLGRPPTADELPADAPVIVVGRRRRRQGCALVFVGGQA